MFRGKEYFNADLPGECLYYDTRPVYKGKEPVFLDKKRFINDHRADDGYITESTRHSKRCIHQQMGMMPVLRMALCLKMDVVRYI